MGDKNGKGWKDMVWLGSLFGMASKIAYRAG